MCEVYFVFMLPSCLYMYHGMMLTLCSTTMTCEHLLSANLTTREHVFVLLNAKN